MRWFHRRKAGRPGPPRLLCDRPILPVVMVSMASVLSGNVAAIGHDAESAVPIRRFQTERACIATTRFNLTQGASAAPSKRRFLALHGKGNYPLRRVA